MTGLQGYRIGIGLGVARHAEVGAFVVTTRSALAIPRVGAVADLLASEFRRVRRTPHANSSVARTPVVRGLGDNSLCSVTYGVQCKLRRAAR